MTPLTQALTQAAEEYSEKLFALAPSFSVMKDVCNDEIYADAFEAGGQWMLAHLQGQDERIKELEAELAKAKLDIEDYR